MLDNIKNNVSKQSDQNEAAADTFRGLLENYESKLNELDKALKDAVDLLKKANAQNSLNAETLADMQVIKNKVVKDLVIYKAHTCMLGSYHFYVEDLVFILNISCIIIVCVRRYANTV